ncbi:MAG: ABC transporter permease [Bacteroidales bacterium]|nr:ABC transporter permease [Bacteroidales bacterium]MBQ5538843.1 ABC transporter permease [Bacteroidales bacterium]
MKSKIKQVVKFEFLRIVKTKGFIIALILAPFLMGGGIAALIYFTEQSNDRTTEEISIGVKIPASDSLYIPIVSAISAKGWTIVENSDAGELRQLTLDNRLKGYIEYDSVKGVSYYSDKLADLYITNTITQIVQNVNRSREIRQLGLDEEQVSRLLNPESVSTYKLSSETSETAEAANANAEYGIKLACGTVFFMLFAMSLMMFSLSVGRSVLEDKSTKIVDVLLTSVKPEQLLTGKILGISAASFLQMSTWIIIGAVSVTCSNVSALSGISDILTPGIWAMSAVFFLFGFFAATAVYASIGAMSETEQHFNRLSSYVIWIIMLPCFFMGPIAQNPDSTLANVLSFIPIMSSSLMPFRVIMVDVPVWQILTSFGILLISTFLLIKLSAKIFRNGIMQQGKEFGFKDIFKWLK